MEDTTGKAENGMIRNLWNDCKINGEEVKKTGIGTGSSWEGIF